jgi:uncharacterized protein with HEPN domain
MMKREYQDFIKDIIDSVQDIEQFIGEMSYDEFIRDKKTLNAVIRSIEIMGEAAKSIPASIQEKNASVPWKKMSGMRDRLIHGYFGIDNEILWKTIKEDLPPLLPIIKKLFEII